MGQAIAGLVVVPTHTHDPESSNFKVVSGPFDKFAPWVRDLLSVQCFLESHRCLIFFDVAALHTDQITGVKKTMLSVI